MLEMEILSTLIFYKEKKQEENIRFTLPIADKSTESWGSQTEDKQNKQC
jgi:hypothetical protein